MPETTNKQPIGTKQSDRVQAAIWRQDSEAGNTDKPFDTVTISRSYKGSDDAWHRSHSFTTRDLPHVALAIEWAMRELLLKED